MGSMAQKRSWVVLAIFRCNQMPDRSRESLKNAPAHPDLEMHELLSWFLINCRDN
jgi:hypothetical protein